MRLAPDCRLPGGGSPRRRTSPWAWPIRSGARQSLGDRRADHPPSRCLAVGPRRLADGRARASVRLVWHRRGPDGLAPASYLALHPAATAPVVQDGDRTLSESAAILEYICHKYAGGRLTVPP